MNKLRQNTTHAVVPRIVFGASKVVYVCPRVDFRLVELESCFLAAASVGYVKPNTPTIEDWGDGGSGNGDIVI